MKRSFLSVLLLLFCFMSSYSQSADEYSEEQVSETEDIKTLKKEQKKKAKELKKALERQEKEKRRLQTDSYLGVVYTSENKCAYKKDGISVKIDKKNNFFNIFYDNGSLFPSSVLFTGDDASQVSLLWNKKEYCLNKNHRILKEIRKLEEGCQISYLEKNKFQVVMDFKLVPSRVGGEVNLVKVSVYTTNLSADTANAGIKLTLNTALTKNDGGHFILQNDENIIGERQITDFSDVKIIGTSDKKLSADFIISGARLVTPQAVTFANKNVIARAKWLPDVDEGRNFNDVFALYDSAMCVNWPVRKIESYKTDIIEFYIALAEDEAPTSAAEFLALLEADNENYVQYDVSDKAELMVNSPDVDFVVAKSGLSQFDPEYVQRLIERIGALQSDPRYVDRNQVRQLNAELDAILSKIRQ